MTSFGVYIVSIFVCVSQERHFSHLYILVECRPLDGMCIRIMKENFQKYRVRSEIPRLICFMNFARLALVIYEQQSRFIEIQFTKQTN